MFKRVRPHHLVIGFGVFWALFAIGSGVAPLVFGWFDDSSVQREVFENVPSAWKLGFYSVLPVLFVCGAVCMATKRNAIGVLIGVELVLNGANVNFVAFASFPDANKSYPFEIEGMMFALFVIVLAAAEAAVALAIVLNFYNNHMTVDVDTAEELKG